MAFRSNEVAANTHKRARLRVTDRLDGTQREEAGRYFDELVLRHGPVVTEYPIWHPFICHEEFERGRPCNPEFGKIFKGLDHTIFLRSAFLTFPYPNNAEQLAQSIKELGFEFDQEAGIDHEVLETLMFDKCTVPILVTCYWNKCVDSDGLLPTQGIAVARWAEEIVKYRHVASRTESWRNVAHLALGEPCGSRSSLFVDEKTGQAMKRVYNALIAGEVFGPVE